MEWYEWVFGGIILALIVLFSAWIYHALRAASDADDWAEEHCIKLSKSDKNEK